MGKELVDLPGKVTRIGWTLPKQLSEDDWIACGKALSFVEAAVQWWLGDWWAYGEQRQWGKGREIAEKIGVEYQTLQNYGWVARSVQFSSREENLSFRHHWNVAALPPAQQSKWLARAIQGEDGEPWSSNQLKAAIAQQAAIERTSKVELEAAALGKFIVLYVDPPWRYEHAPLGGDNRAIENQYPTMELAEICAMPVADIVHDNAVLFMWATSPKLAECMQVLDAWGFTHRTTMVWVKDVIGMGYHARERHEILLIAKRGELPPPPVEARPDSVQQAPRLEHSAKPPIFYDLIDAMYPGVRKIELFGRAPENRELWVTWGNQAQQTTEAAE